MVLSREQLHRVIDHPPAEKLPALADLIDKLIDDDDESVSDAEVAEYKRIRQEMRKGTLLLLMKSLVTIECIVSSSAKTLESL